MIREFRTKNPKITAVEIVAEMSKKGTPVSAPLVYQVLNGRKSTKKRGRKPGPKKATAVASVKSSASFNESLFSSMQQFVASAGGIDKAIAILSVFKK